MNVSLQIDRLESINEEIEHCLRNDDLDSIQALIDERKSRISRLLSLEGSGKQAVFTTFRDRLNAIKEAGDSFGRLIEIKLMLLSKEMRKTSDTRILNTGYAKGSPQLAAEIRRTTDITG